jgi:uncharacterized protein YjbJ (UPF0337 family)
MNIDIVERHWQEVKGRIKEWWEDLTDADLDKVGGNSEQLVTMLQHKYGYTKEHAEDQLSQLVESINVR